MSGVRRPRYRVYASATLALFLVSGLPDLCCAGDAPSAAAPKHSMIHGVNALKLDEESARLAAYLGAMVRVPFFWHHIQPDGPEHWDFSVPDRNIELARQSGTKLLGILCYSAPWASTNPNSANARLHPPAHLPNFYRYVEKIVLRYPEIEHWEIWNEPNVDGYWMPLPNAPAYTRLLKGAYQTVKGIRPSAKVLIGGPAAGGVFKPRSHRFGLNFLAEVYAAGGGPYFDILALHPYRRHIGGPHAQPSLEAELAPVLALMSRHGDASKPIWFTEVGWNVEGDLYAVDEASQAKYLRELFLEAKNLPNVEAVFWYELKDRCPERKRQCRYGLVSYDNQTRPAFSEFHRIAR